MTSTPVSADDDEVGLWEIWDALWSSRALIVAIVAGFSLCGVTYAMFAQEWYKAEVVLAPVNQQADAGGALAGLGLGGLASLAGINLPGASDPQAVAVLRSKDFARDFIEGLKLMPVLLEGVSAGSKPLDIRDAVRVFDRRVRAVTENPKTRLVTLSIRWKDPETAALWANALAKRLNNRLRDRAVAEAERNVTYLTKEITSTNVVSLQQAIGSMLETEMQKLMLARGNEEYAFKVIDQAVPPKERDSPKRLMIALVSFLAGGFISTTIVLMRQSVRSRVRR
jgi:uncharacterized protein involved in exopolysaccharide biosynthesis